MNDHSVVKLSKLLKTCTCMYDRQVFRFRNKRKDQSQTSSFISNVPVITLTEDALHTQESV